MQALIYFAGWRACTPEQEIQKSMAEMVGIGLFIVLAVGTYFLFRYAIRSKKLSIKLKIMLYALLWLLASPIYIGIPFIVAFIMTPWCA